MTKQQRRKAQQRKKNNSLLLWGLAAALVIGLAAVGLILQRTAGASTLPSEIPVAEAAAKKDAGAFLLDVRQPDEWNDFHIAGSTLIPLDQLPARLNELPKDQEIVVVCRTGHRSAEGRDILLNAGFTQVTSMTGGLTQWKAAGYPTVNGP
jgi:rhodanese-related sulfurtransferase